MRDYGNLIERALVKEYFDEGNALVVDPETLIEVMYKDIIDEISNIKATFPYSKGNFVTPVIHETIDAVIKTIELMKLQQKNNMR